MPRLHVVLLAIALLPACKSGSAAGAQSASSHSVSRNPDLILGDEIQQGIASGLATAYDLVARLHPNWFNSVGRMQVQVWVDGQHYGGVTALRSVLLTSTVSIRSLSPSQAQGELGLDNQGGAIVVVTGR